jgi:hypothetical protein
MIHVTHFKFWMRSGIINRVWLAIAVSLFSCAAPTQTHPVMGVWVARDDSFPGSTNGACFILTSTNAPLQPHGNGLQSVYPTEVPTTLAEVLIGLIGQEVAPIATSAATPPPVVNQAFVFSFFVPWVALFVDEGLTQFVPL